MKNKLFTVILSILMAICVGSYAYADIDLDLDDEDTFKENRKSSWYIGFGFGTGNAKVEGDSFEDIYDDYGAYYGLEPDTSPLLTFNFGIGAILNPKFHLGLDITAIRQEASYEGDLGTADISMQINNYLGAITIYPQEKGFFIKGGLGMSIFVLEASNTLGYDESESYTGNAFLIGCGYDFWLGETFNLGIHLEYSKQSYNDEEAPDDSDFTSFYISLYWF